MYSPFVLTGIEGRWGVHTVPGTLISKSSWTALIRFDLFNLIRAGTFLFIVWAKCAGGNIPSKNRLVISRDTLKFSKKNRVKFLSSSESCEIEAMINLHRLWGTTTIQRIWSQTPWFISTSTNHLFEVKTFYFLDLYNIIKCK